MPKAKKKAAMARISEEHDAIPDADNESVAPSCSSNSSGLGSVSVVDFLEAKIQWQEKTIKELEKERNFLRSQIMKKKSNYTVEDEEDDDMDEGDLLVSSPNISDSSERDASPEARSQKRHRQSRSPKRTSSRALSGRAHMRVKGPDEVVERYKRVLKTFKRVRTMTEAFNINNVDHKNDCSNRGTKDCRP
ncbi:unnamed protein product [Arctogadus glacialis]